MLVVALSIAMGLMLAGGVGMLVIGLRRQSRPTR